MIVVVDRGPLAENTGPNAHVHHMKKARAVQAMRASWGQLTTEAVAPVRDQLPFARIQVLITAYFCRRKWTPADPYRCYGGYRPKDGDNLIGAMKPAIDGMRDAGVVLDDDASRVTILPPSIIWLDDFERERVEMTIAEDQEEA